MCNAAQTASRHRATMEVRKHEESSMNGTRALVIAAVGVALSGSVASAQSGPVASAQDLSRYRVYVLESSLDSVIAASGARAEEARTLHEQPAKIQELEWRAPYLRSGSGPADPVREIVFSFYNDALYQVVVSYDRDRTEGLTNRDIIESLSAAYGLPLLVSVKPRTSSSTALADTIVLARWDNEDSSLTLVRDSYSPEFQLIVTSKALNTRAREAIRLDGIEAPRRESELRIKEAADATAARDMKRVVNKAAFRP
jgi:hypothetical protein